MLKWIQAHLFDVIVKLVLSLWMEHRLHQGIYFPKNQSSFPLPPRLHHSVMIPSIQWVLNRFAVHRIEIDFFIVVRPSENNVTRQQDTSQNTDHASLHKRFIESQNVELFEDLIVDKLLRIQSFITIVTNKTAILWHSYTQTKH